GLTREEIDVRLERLSVPAAVRPEGLTLDQFVALFREFGGDVESAEGPRVDSGP
ncbi:MAG: hypothetical protein IH616_00720, partial [Gemmatimonadales bacterium]|nr:hypothetical protein [Gemmatimonadales bacterium]